MDKPKWLTIAVLVVLLISLYLNWSWTWGLLFIYWVVPSVQTGTTLLITPLTRESEPVLFWTVTLLWVVIGFLMVAYDVYYALYPNAYYTVG